MIIQLHPQAQQELWQAAAWYEAQQKQLGMRFMHEVRQTFEAISDFPTLTAPLPVEIVGMTLRKRRVGKFPFFIVYEVVGDVLNVLAVMHAHRYPNYWLARGQKIE